MSQYMDSSEIVMAKTVKGPIN